MGSNRAGGAGDICTLKGGAFRANGVRKLDYQLGDDMTECTESYKDMSF